MKKMSFNQMENLAGGECKLFPGNTDNHPFGRMHADIATGRQHLSNQFESLGRVYGAKLFGIDNNKDMVV